MINRNCFYIEKSIMDQTCDRSSIKTFEFFYHGRDILIMQSAMENFKD